MRNEAYNCDCIEYMRTLPDNYFDIAVCDPPYGSANAEELVGGGRFGGRFHRYFIEEEQVCRQVEQKVLSELPPPKIGADSREGGENDITNQPLPRRHLGNTIQTLFGDHYRERA